MWPGMRSLGEMLVSALLFSFLLLWRSTTRFAVVVLLVTGCCFLGYYFAVSNVPDEYFWYATLGSNPTEAWEYASSYRGPDLLLLMTWLLPSLAAAALLWRRAPLLQHRLGRTLGWLSLALWVAWASVGVAKGYSLKKAISRLERVYPQALAQGFVQYQSNAISLYHTPPAQAPAAPPMVDVLVVVLGESASAHRWSLLGYNGAPTNDSLMPLRDQFVVLPVTANGNNTGKTLPVLITGQRMSPLPESGALTYLDWAHAAGFRVESMGNQVAEGFFNVAMRQRSDRFLQLQNGALDGALSKPFTQTLANKQLPLLVTLHLYGSHPRVEKRYPAEQARWTDPYDNSIRYTSDLLTEWIQQLNALPKVRAAMVYISDHGQDFPVCGGSYSHGATRSAYEVPLMLWANQALRDTQPAWWESLLQQQLMAVDTKGVPRYNSLLMAQWLKTLLGQAPSPNDLPTTHYQLNMPEITGAYPPAEDASNCGPWTAQVQALHPAAVR
jgi:glucan phosphoethanolaminetransferase (alkaline phosphatase superfamily)